MADGLRIPATAYQFDFDAAAAPAIAVDPGATVTVATLDCFCNRIDRPDQVFATDAEVLAFVGGRYNPINRPIAVRGAEPGDRLAVTIGRIALADRGVTLVTRQWGGVHPDDGPPLRPATTICTLRDGGAEIPLRTGTLRRPVEPMVGTIGTAPAGAPISSLLYGPSHGGNMDCPAVREGATVLLPVNVPGALLSLGDVHALMGDGELTGTALEAAAEVTVTIGLEKQAAGALRLDAPGRIGSLGCVSDDVGANVAAATRDMIARLGEVAGHDAADAFQLIGLVGRLTVNQSVRLGALGWGSVLLTVPADCLAPK